MELSADGPMWLVVNANSHESGSDSLDRGLRVDQHVKNLSLPDEEKPDLHVE